MNANNKRYRPVGRPSRPGAMRRKNSPLPLIVIAACTLLVILLAIFLPRACSGRDGAVPVAAPAATPTPTVETTPPPSVTPAPEATQLQASAAPEAAAQAETTPGPTSETLGDDAYTQDEIVGARPTAMPGGYLPIFSKAQTSEKIIAITVDDCNQTENLRQIVQCAIDNGGKLTILPIGENLMQSENLRQVIRYAYENGMEFENHTYSHPAFYRMSAEDMAAEIFNANRVLSMTLGVNYQMHFMRTRGGDNRRDLRTHQYIAKLGYYGMAHWTMSGSSSSIPALHDTLAPGNIYLFHTTDNDLYKLLDFIPYATGQGYRLVTLNEMFGYPENEVTEITAPLEQLEVPAPDPYVYEYKLLNEDSINNYVWDVCLVQQRLIELGWLDDEADGVYGKGTTAAVRKFQNAAGIEVSGDATPQTQRALFSPSAPYTLDGETPIKPLITHDPSVPLRTTPPRDTAPEPTVDLTLFD